MDKPTIPEVMPLVEDYYAALGNGAGGRLHIVLDDGNIDKCNIEYCMSECAKHDDIKGLELCRLLLRMSKTQRKKIYRTHFAA